MGNCCFKTESSMGWDGEDWGSFTSKRSSKVFDEGQGLSLGNVEREKLIGMLRASSDADGKVKIKISKKELKKLLGDQTVKNKQADHEGHGQHGHASAEQVLVGLINARDHHGDHHWKPALQSIPEV
uniref:Uncharacterized protein n=1 Tax=Lotus japonicus TaxID=34305 RepID=I3S1D7_LOTJA|nr:unknown [Lotus japonicus]